MKIKRKCWLKRQLKKVQMLPWYWKIVASVAIFFLGGSIGSELFTYAKDAAMIAGFVIIAISLWGIINLWWPPKTKN